MGLFQNRTYLHNRDLLPHVGSTSAEMELHLSPTLPLRLTREGRGRDGKTVPRQTGTLVSWKMSCVHFFLSKSTCGRGQGLGGGLTLWICRQTTEPHIASSVWGIGLIVQVLNNKSARKLSSPPLTNTHTFFCTRKKNCPTHI